jgi:hypothetical protein
VEGVRGFRALSDRSDSGLFFGFGPPLRTEFSDVFLRGLCAFAGNIKRLRVPSGFGPERNVSRKGAEAAEKRLELLMSWNSE